MPVSYPNQKVVVINRDIPKQTKENKDPYMIAYTKHIEEAAQNIHKVSSFKLYLYLLANQNNYRFALSTQDFADRYGLSIDAAKTAVNDLISLGYLVLRDKLTFDFYEKPRLIEDIQPQVIIKKKFLNKDDEPIELTFDELAAKVGKEKAESIWRSAQ